MTLAETIALRSSRAVKDFGYFGVRHRAMSAEDIVKLGDKNSDRNMGWYRVSPGQKPSRNTPIMDTHAWARVHVTAGLQSLMLYASSTARRVR